MRHKIRVWGRHKGWLNQLPKITLWYVECECGWQIETYHDYGNGQSFYGRPSWDLAYALGVAHQKEAKDTCDCE